MEILHTADRRDVELVALFTLCNYMRDVTREHALQAGETEEQADARMARWLTGPPTRDPLDSDGG